MVGGGGGCSFGFLFVLDLLGSFIQGIELHLSGIRAGVL